MKFSYLASVALITALHIPQIASANALTTDATKKIASSDAAKIAMSVVTPAVNSKAIRDLTNLKRAQALAETQQKSPPITGGLSGGSRVLRAFEMRSSNAE